MNSLDNLSRQYFDQGVKGYDGSEYGIAKERFDKALEANRTNYFAYEYLGFIAVAEDNQEGAEHNFELARKFAETNHHRALALSHLGRCRFATGDIDTASNLANQAAELVPEEAAYWYAAAGYFARLGKAEQCVHVLRKAIELDWNYWAVVGVDRTFDGCRREVWRLLETLKGEEHERAAKALALSHGALDTARKVAIGVELVEEAERRLSKMAKRMQEGNLYLYRQISSEARECAQELYEVCEKTASERIAKIKAALAGPNFALARLNPTTPDGIFPEEWVVPCGLVAS